MPFGWPQQMGTAALQSMLTGESLRCGMDHAELAAALSNLMAMLGLVSPYAYQSIYQYGKRRGDPGLAFRGFAAVVALQALVSCTLTGDYSRKKGRSAKT